MMSLPTDHFSWSQFDTYVRDPEEYFTRYALGVKPPPTPPMLLGTIHHRAYSEPEYDWRAALREACFTPDYERGLEKALKDPHLSPTSSEPREREKRMTAPLKGFSGPNGEAHILAFIDALDPGLWEWKTGRSKWTQAKVDAHHQLTLYAYLIRENLGSVPDEITLKHIDPISGRVTTLKTHRTDEDVDRFMEEMFLPVVKLIDDGIFHRTLNFHPQFP